MSDLYLQLEIIKEGLQLKLEIKSIKEQFLTLLQNYDQFDKATGTLPKGALAQVAPGSSATTPKGLSAARARVRALYDTRKQRLQARRAAIGLSGAGGKAPSSSGKFKSGYCPDDNEDKENMAVGFPPSLKVRNKQQQHNAVPTSRSHRRAKLNNSSNKKLLTPIKEEVRSRPNGTSSEVSSSPAISDVEGEYVRLKPLSTDRCGNYMNISPDAPFQSIQSPCDNTSIWVNSTDNLHKPAFSPGDSSLNPLKGVSPIHSNAVKYATSDTISELYTSKSLKDLSHISRFSHSSIHEQVSGNNLNLSGAFHSTFNYPLHSTMQYPMNSTITADLPEEITVKSCDEAEHGGNTAASDARTTVSEPSVIIRSRSLSPNSCHAQDQQPRYLDDSYMGRFKPVNNNNNGEFKLPRPPLKKQRVKKTPQTQVPILCKEHGLHPNTGGPCIFQTDDSFTLTDDSQDELDTDQRRNSSKAVTETDCDSSYLSECMDNESHCGFGGFSEAEEMTATYDARNGRMKMLRRQTGQTALQNKSQLRSPIGLSESDFLDVTKKHFSIEATRASLPDLSALSTPSEEGENSESTLHASKLNNTVKENSNKNTPSASLNNTLVNSNDPKDQRPLSIATTSTSNTSPESNTGCQVPANSPNITDTNSSSRQNTDNYDYVEVPIKKHIVRQQLQQQQAMRAITHSHPRRRRHNTTRSTCTLYTKREEPTAQCSSSSMTARKCLRYNHEHFDSGFSTPVAKRTRPPQGRHITITDNAGSTRTVVQHSAVANLQKERKKQLVKKLKQFNSNFHTAQSTGNLQNIRTLGHF